MPFQTRVNTELPAAMPGDFASSNPRITTIGVEGSWYAGPQGVAAASFVWVNEDTRQAANSTAGATAYTASGAAVGDAGTGYVVGDILTIPGAGKVSVTTIGTGGAITAVGALTDAVTSSTNMAGTIAASGGTGSGATFAVTSTTATVAGAPDGFVRRGGLAAITTYPQAASMVMLPGTPLTIYDNGEFWVQLPAGVTSARKGAVYCDPTSGGIVASGADGAVATGYYYVESGTPGDMVKISSWLRPAS
ncbi:structural cement protein Gp24 [Novacetimonas pomaceti]|uniref:structural cement protein Gp24 n=1 Tax=Novacetimonas pomaceti TaxID=2021998 RepID=UPI001C2D0349|nr:hypothetical protein [Novacetimonas pomaceti]MBV1833070.1 hypothetical protein [Novacetimonas pomaceti]